MTNYIYRFEVKRPIKSRLIVTVCFAKNTQPLAARRTVLRAVRQVSSVASEQEKQGEQPWVRAVDTAASHAKVAMRLRLVGSSMFQVKEDYHAESLLA